MKTGFIGDSLNYFNLGNAIRSAKNTLAHYNEEKSTSQRRRNTDFGVHFLIQREGGFFVENNTLYVLRKERYEYRYLPWKSMKEKKINLP